MPAREITKPQGQSHQLTEDVVRSALEKVVDPELGWNIVELGLVRAIVVTDELLQLDMTLTSPACPYAPELLDAVMFELTGLAGHREPLLKMVFDPPWDPRTDASEDVKAEMDIWD